MNFEISGKLILKEDTVYVTDSFKKREFVIEVVNERNTDWNDFIKFQLIQDKCQLLDNIDIGETFKVSFNIKGRKWEKDGKITYITNLDAWRLEKNITNEMQFSQPPPDFAAPLPTENDIPPIGSYDNTPF